jgi:DNA polymerase-3 subunit epsilon
VVAHHAPFDLGFLCIELERAQLPLPKEPVLCSSLLSRSVIPESRNHRLQTLITYLGLKKGAAHRALDDAEACFGVLQYCIERLGKDSSLQKILQHQGGPIHWGEYSLQSLCSHAAWRVLIEACRKQTEVQITYSGGSRPGQARTVKAFGVVRNPKGDFLVAQEGTGTVAKRYYLKKITAATF